MSLLHPKYRSHPRSRHKGFRTPSQGLTPGAQQATPRVWEQTLSAPIELKSNEHLIVAVEMSGTSDEKGIFCLDSCDHSKPLSDPTRSYWSNAKTRPYNWAALSGFGLGGDLFIQAIGN